MAAAIVFVVVDVIVYGVAADADVTVAEADAAVG